MWVLSARRSTSAEFGSVVNAAFGARLRRARRSKDISQEELAVLVGLSRVTVATIEAGGQNVQLQHVFRFAQALDVPIDELIPSVQEIDQRQTSLRGARGYAASGEVFLEDARALLRHLRGDPNEPQKLDEAGNRRPRSPTPKRAPRR
jgi:transcriptional regulator with XRE-family HTH domain